MCLVPGEQSGSGEREREEAKRIVMEVSAASTAPSQSTGEGAGREAGGRSEAEELREVLNAIADFIQRIKGPIRELVTIVLAMMDGAKLGEDVAAFYKQVKESGLPDEVALEMTRQYFRERLEAANLAGLLAKFLRRELIGEEKNGKGLE